SHRHAAAATETDTDILAALGNDDTADTASAAPTPTSADTVFGTGDAEKAAYQQFQQARSALGQQFQADPADITANATSNPAKIAQLRDLSAQRRASFDDLVAQRNADLKAARPADWKPRMYAPPTSGFTDNRFVDGSLTVEDAIA